MILKKDDIKKLNKIQRINLMNSVTGIKSVNLIGTKSNDNVSNLAIFSSVVHISSNPPLFGFFLRSNASVRRDTYENIISQKKFTLNSVNISKIKNAHLTSIKFEKHISEFNMCKFSEENKSCFSAPFVLESEIKLGLVLKEVVNIKSSTSKLIIGEVNCVFINDDFIEDDFSLNLEKSNSASICGLNNYYSNEKVLSLPYARLEKLNEILNNQ